MFAVNLSNKAKKQFGSMDPQMHSRVKQLFLVLEHRPMPFGAYDLKKLKGEENTYRVRLSSYRVVYKVNPEQMLVDVAKIERRSEHTY